MPEVVLKDEATPDVKPGETFKYSLTVGLNQNSEIFRNFELCVPFSDYVDYFEDISITFAKDKGGRNDWNPKPYPSNGLVYLNTDGVTDKAIGNESSNWSNWKSTKGSTFLNALNHAMRDADTLNYQRFLSDPTSIKQRVLKFKMDSIINISDVQSNEAIVITFTMKAKEAGNWAYEKNSLKGSQTSYVPQSELSFTTPTDRSSVLESMDKNDPFDWRTYMCDQRGRGAGGGGGGGGGGGWRNKCLWKENSFS